MVLAFSDLSVEALMSPEVIVRCLICLDVIVFFLIFEPLMSLAASAGPPRATKRAINATTSAGEGLLGMPYTMPARHEGFGQAVAEVGKRT